MQTKNGNLRLGWVGPLSLTVLDATVDAAEWREMLELAKEHRANEPATVALLVARKASIGAEHRKLTAEFSQDAPPMKAIALATDSALTRGALTAYSWLTKGGPTQYRVFDVHEHKDAIAWLRTLESFDEVAAHRLMSELLAQTRASSA